MYSVDVNIVSVIKKSPLLPTFILDCVIVCACAFMCVRVCVSACMCVCDCVRVCMRNTTIS